MSDTVPSTARWPAQEVATQHDTDLEKSPDEYFSSTHWKRVYGQAYSMVRNPADAEDLAQEAYLRLHEAVLNGRKIESCVAWMRGVVRHVLFQRLRKTRPDLHIAVEVEDDAGAVAHNLIDPATSIEDRLVEENLLHESLRVLAGLPERDRECIMMYARGYTFVQIARVLNIPYEVAIRTTRKALLKTRRKIER